MRPTEKEYAPYYGKYIEMIPQNHPLAALEASLQEAGEFLSEIPEDKADFRYAEGKWTVKELLQHITDTERIMAWRALCFARNEEKALPGFDENAYAQVADVSGRGLKDLREELMDLKKSNISLFRSFTPEALLRRGIMNGVPGSVRALGFIIAGHQRHHFNILEERYF